jgi:hypothetical protein
MWAFIKCIQGEESRFNHLLIQMNAGLAARKKTSTTNAIQTRLDCLYARFNDNNIDATELLHGLSSVVAKSSVSKKKN